jgi:pyridoxal phosphate enzyme (YggS family)
MIRPGLMINYPKFEKNAELIENKIAGICAQCGREPNEIKVLAVTKSHAYQAVEYAERYGYKAIGENLVQEASDKKQKINSQLRWEFIGHLQSNKAKLAVATFDRIQSVDRLKILKALDRYSGESNKTLPVLLQINAGEDPAKYGATIETAPALLEAALQCNNIKVEGLMTIAPLSNNRDLAANCFEHLRTLRDSLAVDFGTPLPELSMGMTGDMIQAIEAGSTLIRIGTALYGERENK